MTALGAPSLSKADQARLLAAQSFMSFDFGTRRIGVGVGNALTGQAKALLSVAIDPSQSAQQTISACLAHVQEWQPDALVIGLPTYPDGNAHQMTYRALRFARRLYEAAQLPVVLVDERYSSTEAHTQQATDIDAVAAKIILQRYLDTLPGAMNT